MAVYDRAAFTWVCVSDEILITIPKRSFDYADVISPEDKPVFGTCSIVVYRKHKYFVSTDNDFLKRNSISRLIKNFYRWEAKLPQHDLLLLPRSW